MGIFAFTSCTVVGNWSLVSSKMSIPRGPSRFPHQARGYRYKGIHGQRGVWCFLQEIVSGLHRGLSSVAQQHGGEILQNCSSFGKELNEVLPSKDHVKP